MTDIETITEGLIDSCIIGIVRLPDPDSIIDAVSAARAGGVKAIEITMSNVNALQAIATIRERHGDDILLGVGSVLDAATARAAVDAGARYVISPVFSPAVIDAAHAAGAAAIAGTFTPTEAQQAHEAGSDLIKVFPAHLLGPAYISALLAPLPHLRLLPTGGIRVDNVASHLRAGATALGVGSALFHRPTIANGDFEGIRQRARALMHAVHEARRSP